MRVVRITAQNEREFSEQIRSLEAHAVYPLGTDFFRLDHGPDYFAFFRRLGELRTYAAVVDGRVACAASAVLRPVRQIGGQISRAWYLCDLKVDLDFRGLHLPARLFRRAFLPAYLRCTRGFAVTMNPGDGSPNRVVRILERLPWIPLRPVGELVFYVWSEGEVLDVAPLLDAEIGAWRLRSLAGVKNLILGSTGKPWNLHHIEGRYCLYDTEDGEPTRAIPGGAHMLCLPRGGVLDRQLEAAGFRNAATASIVAHRMTATDWSFAASSEI
jgi:hypothetical protein